MELHGYLDHSFRVLSHPDRNALPEILEHAHTVPSTCRALTATASSS